MKVEQTYEQWYEIFIHYLKHTLDYDGPVDYDTFEADWENGISPEDAARSFFSEMES